MVGDPRAASALRPWLPLILLVAVLVTVVAVVRATQPGAPLPPPPAASPPTPPTAEPAATPAATVALFLGDAYTAGAGASSGAARWTSLVSEEMGWRELNLGRRGTGYRAEPPPDVCGFSQCPSFLRMTIRAAEEQPDVVIVAGGQNDAVLAHYYPSLQEETIEATFTALRDMVPDALIVAVGPLPIWGASDVLRGIDHDVREAVESVGGVFVSLLEPAPLQLVPSAEVEDASHRAIAERVLRALRSDVSIAAPVPNDCAEPSGGSSSVESPPGTTSGCR